MTTLDLFPAERAAAARVLAHPDRCNGREYEYTGDVERDVVLLGERDQADGAATGHELMKLAILLLCLALPASALEVSVEYVPGTGAFVTVPDVGPGFLEVQRSTDLTNWTTFAIAGSTQPRPTPV